MLVYTRHMSMCYVFKGVFVMCQLCMCATVSSTSNLPIHKANQVGLQLPTCLPLVVVTTTHSQEVVSFQRDVL